MSKKKKISLILCAVLVAVIASVSVISYSIANIQNSDLVNNANGSVSPALVQRGGNLDNMDYVTNIDLIIENSQKGETFNIVEIFTADEYNASSDLSKYVSNGGFKQYVIDANGTKKDASGNKLTMKEGTINYKAVQVTASTDLTSDDYAEVNATLNAADLIYVSNQTYNSFDGKMSESVYNFLHTYALGEGKTGGKPIIVDYVAKSEKPVNQKKTYKDLVNAISGNYLKYHTFYWNTSLSVDDFFNANGDSYYVPFNVNNNKATGKILVISNGANTIRSAWENYGKADFIKNAYYGRNAKRPSADDIEFTTMSPAQIAANPTVLATLGFAYDFVIIENDVMSTEFSDDTLYNSIRSLSVANKFIVYDKSNITTNNDSQDAENNNYRKLLDLLVYSTGEAKVSNVLKVSPGFFGTLLSAGADGLETAKTVADLLDGSNYRGNKGTGSNGKMFRVLEIEPCYPIDTDVALSEKDMGNDASKRYGVKGNYYSNPYNVLNGVSQDEVKEGQEYYKFKLSIAKIAYATGLKPSQIQIDQMSSEEFISSKDVVLETYDLVYIGGDHSALMPTLNKELSKSWSKEYANKAYKITTSFEMYTHTGNLVNLTTYNSNSGVYTTYTDHPYGKMKDSNGNYAETTVALNGNDLTSIKKNELLDYIKAGMPIVFGSDVSQAFEKVYNLPRLEQLAARDIDPDSQMFSLLSTVYDKYKDNATVVWNADLTEEKVNNFYYLDDNDNPTVDETDHIVENAYGNSLSKQVTVFTAKTNTDVKNAVNASNARPVLTIDEQPMDYVYGDKSSYNQNTGELVIKAKVKAVSTSTAYTMELYTDYDGDGVFDEDELQDSTTYDTSNTTEAKELKYTLPEGFVGLVSWKVIVKDKGSNTEVASCTSSSGYAYYEKPDTEKKEINVLQIMPVLPKNRTRNDSNLGKDGKTGASLYLCTECQHSLHRAYYNIQIDGAWNSSATYNNVYGIKKTARDPEFQLGLHEHKFGIVKYDSSKPEYDGTYGAEDWDYNLADEAIIKDNYDINLTILYVDEFEKIVSEVASHSNADGTSKVKETIENADGSQTTITWKDYYDANAEVCYDKWETAKSELTTSGVEDDLYNWLNDFIEANPSNLFTKADLENKEYYEFFMKNTDYYDASQRNSEIRKLYKAYQEKKDAEIEAHQAYNEAMMYAATSKTWLSNNFDMVVLGFAEDFGGADLTTEACNDLKEYLNNNGNLLTTHDSTTRYYDGGSVNLTNELRATFGMDRFHMTLDDVISKVGEFEVSENNTAKYYPILTWQNHSYCGASESMEPGYDYIYQCDVNATDTVDVCGTPMVNGLTQISKQKNASGNTTIQFINSEGSTISGYACHIADTSQATYNDWERVAADYVGDTNPLKIRAGLVGDPNGVITKKMNGGNVDLKYLQYKVQAGYDSSKYYMTEWSTLGSDTRDLRQIWQAKVYSAYGGNANFNYIGLRSAVGVTDAVGIFETDSRNSSPYTYAEYNLQEAIYWNQGVSITKGKGTDRASQVNDGIITTYPFAISSELMISGTHSQTYALDLEDSNVSVWYTLGADSAGNKKNSSIYAASPHDGMDSYFMFSKGNVFYCGAGHTIVTGPKRDNNDERRLYVNVIINAARNKAAKPTIKLYNPCDEKDHTDCDDKLAKKLKSGETAEVNKLYLASDGTYEYYVDSKETVPQFDFKVICQKDIKKVQVFYDLNYDDDKSNIYKEDDDHVLVDSYTNYTSGKRTRLREDKKKYPNLPLKPSYFNGNTTYIVVAATDSKNQTSYKRIKIKYIPELFDLTDATLQDNNSINVDYIDKVKFDI